MNTTKKAVAVLGISAAAVLGVSTSPAYATTAPQECVGTAATITVTNDNDGVVGGIGFRWYDLATGAAVGSGGTVVEPLGYSSVNADNTSIYGASTYKIVAQPKTSGHYDDADMIFTLSCS